MINLNFPLQSFIYFKVVVKLGTSRKDSVTVMFHCDEHFVSDERHQHASISQMLRNLGMQ